MLLAYSIVAAIKPPELLEDYKITAVEWEQNTSVVIFTSFLNIVIHF